MNTGKLIRKKFVHACLCLSLMAPAMVFAQTTYDRIVTFGASFSDPGNGFFLLNSLAQLEPLTRDEPCPTIDPLSVPPYDQLDDAIVPAAPYARSGHHFTNGVTWVEYLARSLKMSRDSKPALKPGQHVSSNYAVGAARTYDLACRFNLSDQLKAFKDDSLATSPDTLYIFDIGANDVRDVVEVDEEGNVILKPERISDALANIQKAVIDLYGSEEYNAHARQFLLVNVPAIGETPAVQQNGEEASALFNYLTGLYNDGLEQLAAGLNQALPGINVRILDLNGLLQRILADPAAYGIINTEEACVTPMVAPYRCKKPDTYLFWDGIHPTRTVHKAIAVEARKALEL